MSGTAPPGEHRLTRDLRALLHSRRTGALGTTDPDGQVFVSMVPFALDAATGMLVIHVSGLAAHTRNLENQPRACLMVCEGETPGEPVHALPRVSLDVLAEPLGSGSGAAVTARSAYLQRFPDAEPMTALGDFRFVCLRVLGARQVAGFGAARSLSAEETQTALFPAEP